MRKVAFIILLILPSLLFAQSEIKGKIVSAEGKIPIISASIFLNNTSVGGISADDGTFALHGVRNGQYDLVVSSVGYETYHQDVRVNNESMSLPDILLTRKVNVLKEVKINLDPNRAEHLRTFIKEFLGSSAAARECKILNTDVIDLRYSKRTGVLKGTSDEFILIENKALGYNIKYLLQLFTLNRNKTVMYYAGSAIFEPMQGTPEQEKPWEAKRMAAFNGSTMHFLRSSLHNQLTDELFFVTDEDNKKLSEQQILKRTDVDVYTRLLTPRH